MERLHQWPWPLGGEAPSLEKRDIQDRYPRQGFTIFLQELPSSMTKGAVDWPIMQQ